MLESVAVEVVEELTQDEQRDRLRLERRVERAAFEGAEALRELRDRRLFRSTHKTFELYCQERFGFTRRRVDYLISGSEVYDNLKMRTNGSQNSSEEDEETEPNQILLTNERQVRPLTKLDSDQQREAWQQAVEVSGGKVPSNRIVKDIVQRIRERTPVPNPYQVGEVCGFIPKDNPELKGKSKCWAIVKEVHDFSCTVQAWDGEYQVKIENLKSQELSPVQREEVQSLCDRLLRLQQINDLDRGALAHLKHLGEQLYLTKVEEKMLSLLEEYYQVADSSNKSKNSPAH